ncbi:coproporphyrinogen III oxidase, partial [Yersinia pestis]
SYRPEWDEGSPEKRLTDYYLKPHNWLTELKSNAMK